MQDTKYKVKIDLNNKNTSHTKIIDLIKCDTEILEFGCSTGYMTKELAKKRCNVIGVEFNKLAAEKAQNYCKKIIIGNIEALDYKNELKNSKFDYIIFADILEHLKNPKSVLIKVKQFLKKGGKLIISVPNIAHSSIRLELLTGDFEYEELGILDETHLKYFTKKSIIRLLDSCGYYIIRLDSVSLGLTIETIKKLLKKINIICTPDILNVFNQPEAIAYQYVIASSLIKPIDYSIDNLLLKPLKAMDHTNLEIKKLQNIIKTSEANMKKIYNSRGWRIISFLHNIRTKIPLLKDL